MQFLHSGPDAKYCGIQAQLEVSCADMGIAVRLGFSWVLIALSYVRC